jgi:hypothetical protein
MNPSEFDTLICLLRQVAHGNNPSEVAQAKAILILDRLSPNWDADWPVKLPEVPPTYLMGLRCNRH